MHPQLPTPQTPSLSLVLPAWNESEVIETAIEEADVALRAVTDRYEIIVVDDGSTDDTAALVARAAAKKPNIKLIRHCPNQGYGAALRTGFAAATMDLVSFTDADCQFDLTELDRFLLLAQRYDVVCGYRIDRKDAPLRLLYSKVYNIMVRTLLGTGVRDVDCAMKVFRREALNDMPITGNGFLVNSEMMVQARQHGFQVVEVGVSHRPRAAGDSTVSIHHIPKVLSSMARYWWNQVLFHAESNTATEPTSVASQGVAGGQRHASSPARYRWGQVALLLVAAAFMLIGLGYPLVDNDEARFAEISREMLSTGNWAVPQLNFQSLYNQPPLLHWLGAISFKVLGVSEFSARVVPAVAALLTLAATMWFATRNFSPRVGLLSGLALALSAGFAFASRHLFLDSVSTLLVSASLFTAYEAIKRDRVQTGWWLGSGVLLGLAILATGPLAIALWVPTVFAMAWLSQSHATLRWLHFGQTCLAAAIVVMPWLVCASIADSSFLYQSLVTNGVGHLADAWHIKSIWYLIAILMVAGFPWSFLSVPYAQFLFSRSQQVRIQRPLSLGYLMLWSVGCFVCYLLNDSHGTAFLIAASPALALMVGHYLDRVLLAARHADADAKDHAAAGNHAAAGDLAVAKDIFGARAGMAAAQWATITTGIVGLGILGYVLANRATGPSLGTGWTAVWASAWIGLLAFAISRIKLRKPLAGSWMTASASAAFLGFMVLHQVIPQYNRSHTLLGNYSLRSSSLGNDSLGNNSLGNDSLANDSLAGSTSPPMVDALASDRTIATVAGDFSEVPFYLGRSNVQHFATIDDDRFAAFAARNADCVLVVDQRIGPDAIQKHLPPDSRLTSLGQRGNAALYQIDRSDVSVPVASRPKNRK